MRVKDAVGRFGEQVAAERLIDAGLEILQRNWRSSSGEIDIVARDGDVLVIVEVKTRSSLAYGSPAEAVDARKAARIRRLSVQWMEQWRTEQTVFWSAVRFDLVCVVRRTADGGMHVEHLVAVF